MGEVVKSHFVTRAPDSENPYPRWSPNAKQIVVMSVREHSTNLWVCAADGSNVRPLWASPDVCYVPSLQNSPDLELIVFGKHAKRQTWHLSVRMELTWFEDAWDWSRSLYLP